MTATYRTAWRILLAAAVLVASGLMLSIAANPDDGRWGLAILGRITGTAPTPAAASDCLNCENRAAQYYYEAKEQCDRNYPADDPESVDDRAFCYEGARQNYEALMAYCADEKLPGGHCYIDPTCYAKHDVRYCLGQII